MLEYTNYQKTFSNYPNMFVTTTKESLPVINYSAH